MSKTTIQYININLFFIFVSTIQDALQSLGAKLFSMSAPFDASRHSAPSSKCRQQMRRYLKALGNFELWAVSSKYINQVGDCLDSMVVWLCVCVWVWEAISRDGVCVICASLRRFAQRFGLYYNAVVFSVDLLLYCCFGCSKNFIPENAIVLNARLPQH